MTAISRFTLRRSEKLRSSLRYTGWLVLISALLVAGTVAPLYLG